MLFLIEYDRKQGRTVLYREFGDDQLREAMAARLELELECSRDGIGHEVVILETDSFENLCRTHRRYTASVPALLAGPNHDR